MIAGYTMLTELKNNPRIYTELEEKTAYLHKGLDKVLKASGTPYVINRLGSMISIHFSDHPVTDFASAASANNDLFKKYFHAMLQRGIYLPPSAFESWFLNNALSYEDLDRTITATEESLKEIIVHSR
jgi:glutamate-1-semialdehyde 2,1-aminomutase